jgi:adenosylcobinamide kinase/adenosylcobinamide-phosphate guanylyltransferase
MSKAELILVTGGARSGKSACAEALAKARGARRFYLATAPVCDAEMADRVRRHQTMRASDNWITIEEEIDLASALRRAVRAGAEVVLVDCLTLWINNLLYRDETLDESRFAELCRALLAEIDELPVAIVMVINEVGLGLVPESALARRFRDLSGRCAQLVAARAGQVYFVVAGINQRIK